MENEAPALDSAIEPAKPYSLLRAGLGLVLLPVILFSITWGAIGLIQNLGDGIDQSLALGLSSSSFLLAALIYTIITGKHREVGSFLKLNSFKWGHILVGLIAALFTYLSATLIAMIVIYLSTLFVGTPELGENSTSQNIGTLSKTHSLFFIGFLVAILAPVGEELFFRGAMLSSLVQDSTKRWIRFFGVVIVSVIFALFHLQDPTGTVADLLAVLTPGLVGLMAAILTLKYNSLYPAIFTHLFYNGTVFLFITLSTV